MFCLVKSQCLVVTAAVTMPVNSASNQWRSALNSWSTIWSGSERRLAQRSWTSMVNRWSEGLQTIQIVWDDFDLDPKQIDRGFMGGFKHFEIFWFGFVERIFEMMIPYDSDWKNHVHWKSIYRGFENCMGLLLFEVVIGVFVFKPPVKNVFLLLPLFERFEWDFTNKLQSFIAVQAYLGWLVEMFVIFLDWVKTC